MSKAILLANTLLSVIGGCFYEIHSNRMLSRIDMLENVQEGYKKTVEILGRWPKDNGEKNAVAWVNNKVDLWEPHVKSIQNYHRLVVLAKVCERCYADLLEKNKSREKVLLLKELEPYIVEINNFIDPEGANFVAYAKSDELMDYLYELIGWE